MGVLTDFVIANLADAQLVGESMNPSQQFDGLDAKGMDQVKMASLYAILTGQDYDSDFLQAEQSFVYISSEQGPWVQLVPHEMVERVAKLSEFETVRIAREWLRTEEDFRYGKWTSEHAVQFLQDLGQLCRRAVADNKAVLMWTCPVTAKS